MGNDKVQSKAEDVATMKKLDACTEGTVGKVTMANGAIVNEKMANHYSEVLQPSVTQITNKITVFENFSLENTVIIEGKEGVIVWDTGSNMGIGKQKYEALRKLTNKPVKAVIYSHNHYTKGARAFVPEGMAGQGVEIIAHPDVHKNMMTSSAELGKVLSKTTAQHFGLFLPREGSDAPPISYDGGSDTDKTSGYLKPTYEVKHEEELVIDGVKLKFYYTPSDTFDSLTLWLPDYDTVITNSIWHVLPNMYTLRGQPYRDPVSWLEGIDCIRKLNPKNLIPSHGSPKTSRESSYELATVYRDVISFIYCQTVRGINKGLKPDEIAEEMILPKHLADHPRLNEVYGELKHQVKGVYSGLIGWFSLDAADINPVPISFRSKKIIEGFGGIDETISACEKSLEQHEYAWVAELVTHVLNIEPHLKQARQIKAYALRQMGQATPALSSRGFYLSQALELEGKIDLDDIPNSFSKAYDEEVAKDLPIETSIKLLEYRIDPERSKEIDSLLSIEFSDVKQKFGLHVRKGIAEFIDYEPVKPNLSISLPSSSWLDLILGKLTPRDVVENQNTLVAGKTTDIIEILEVFDR